MKQIFTRFSLFLTVILLSAHSLNAQQFEWVKGGGTTITDANVTSHPEQTSFLCTDAVGNIYALSHVAYTAIHADTFSFTPYASDFNILLTSYRCDGTMRWAKVITSSDGNCYPFGLVADTSGHIYVAGTLPNADLRIGDDTIITTSIDQVLGIIQFDTNGHFNWVRHLGNNTVASYSATSTDVGWMAMDNQEHVHMIPYLETGSVLIPGDTTKLGTYDISYDATGNLLAIKRLQLDSTLGPFYAAAIDKQNNALYISGYSNASATLGDGDSAIHVFIARFDTAGMQVWQDTLDDPVGEGTQGFLGIAPDNTGHLYMSGGGFGYLIYRGDTIYPTSGSYLTFITKIDTSGNMNWFTECHGNGIATGIAIASNNKIAATGLYYGTLGIGTHSTTNSTPGSDPFIFIVDSSGQPVSLTGMHGDAYNDYGTAIASDKIGNFYIGGAVEDSIPNTLIPAYYSVGGNTDFFILKYGVDCSCTSMPVAAYTTTGTSTVSATYTGTIASGIDSVIWNFGDGATAPGITTIHTYTTVGAVDLCTTVYTGCGQDTHCQTLAVNCGTVTASFIDTGSTIRGFTYTGTTGALDSVVWHFGDGRSATGTTALHTYSASGTYTICATAYTGCGNNTSCATIVINCTPVASFTDTGATVRGFTYTGTTLGLDSVVWSFGDGHLATGLTSLQTYSASGTYTVCVTIYAACGTNGSCSTVVINCTPISSYTSTGSTTRTFTYTGTSISLDSVRWTFGDGTIAFGTTVTHTYSLSATYTVCATAYTACGNNTSCGTVVINCTPVSAFTHSGTLPVSFTYSGTTPGVDSVTWTFGDGSTGTGLSLTHTYSISGTYTVCATAHAMCGNNTSCGSVTVECSPVSAFTHSGSAPVSFAYSGTTSGLDSVVWTFGDGSTASGTAPVHSYSASGTYSVCATVYSACGSDTHCADIVVNCTPAASFSQTGLTTKNFIYTGTTAGVDSTTWNYGDGTSGVGPSVSHTYTAIGTYTVCVTAHSLCGSNTSCSSITISCLTAPIASFLDTGNNPHFFGYIGTLAGYDSLSWSFGDGTDSSGAGTVFEIAHTYTANGTYEVCVTVYTDCGVDSSCKEISISADGIPNISIANIKAFPNPASDALNITGVSESSTTYRLLTVAGVSVGQGSLHAGNNLITMKNLASGVYLLELLDITGVEKVVQVIKE